MNEDHTEDIIVSVIPAAAGRPLLIVGYWKNADGFWGGWSEPVLYTALVERRYYGRPVAHLPRDARGRRVYERARHRVLEPVAYDVNAMTGLSRLSEFQEHPMQGETIDLVPADLDWEELCHMLKTAEQGLAIGAAAS